MWPGCSRLSQERYFRLFICIFPNYRCVVVVAVETINSRETPGFIFRHCRREKNCPRDLAAVCRRLYGSLVWVANCVEIYIVPEPHIKQCTVATTATSIRRMSRPILWHSILALGQFWREGERKMRLHHSGGVD